MTFTRPRISDYLLRSYDQGFHCDLRIFCGSSSNSSIQEDQEDLTPLSCHKLVLCSVSRFLFRILVNHHPSSTGNSHIHLPHFSRATVKALLDAIYNNDNHSSEEEEEKEEKMREVDPELAEMLELEESGFNPGKDGIEEEEEKEDMKSSRKRASLSKNNNRRKRTRKRPRYEEEPSEEEDQEDRIKAEINDRDSREDEEYSQEAKFDPEEQDVRVKEPGPLLLGYEAGRALMEKGEGRIQGVAQRQAPILLWPAGSTRCETKFRMDLRQNFKFRALLGLAQVQGKSRTTFRAKPLAWVDPTAEQIPGQFEATCAAYKHLYGFSEADVVGNPWILIKQGRSKLYQHKNRPFMDRHSALSNEALTALLETPGLKELTRRGEIRPFNLSFRNRWNADLEVDPTLTLEEFGGLAVLASDPLAKKTVLKPVSVEPSRIEDHANDCMRLLFDIWRGTLYFAKSDYLVQRYMAREDQLLVHRLVPKILQTRSEEGDAALTCETCGKVFPSFTANDRQRYHRHQKTHAAKAWSCDCDVTFRTTEDKVRHIKLFHDRKYDYVQCDQCPTVLQKKFLDAHLKGYHRDFVCSDCGKVCRDRNHLYVHKEDHKAYHCAHCGAVLLGVSKWRIHKKNNPECSKQTPQKS